MSKQSVVTFLGTIEQINTYFYERKIKLNRPQTPNINHPANLWRTNKGWWKGRGIRIDKMRFCVLVRVLFSGNLVTGERHEELSFRPAHVFPSLVASVNVCVCVCISLVCVWVCKREKVCECHDVWVCVLVCIYKIDSACVCVCMRYYFWFTPVSFHQANWTNCSPGLDWNQTDNWCESEKFCWTKP